jgi:hypothetical protein
MPKIYGSSCFPCGTEVSQIHSFLTRDSHLHHIRHHRRRHSCRCRILHEGKVEEIAAKGPKIILLEHMCLTGPMPKKIQSQPPTKVSKQIVETALLLQGIRKRERGPNFCFIFFVLKTLGFLVALNFHTMAEETNKTNNVISESQLLSCSSAFDALWFCYSPGNQIKKYYREGTYDDCDIHQRMFSLCMSRRWRLSRDPKDYK